MCDLLELRNMWRGGSHQAMHGILCRHCKERFNSSNCRCIWLFF